MSFWGHFWWFWGQLLGFGARSQARSRLFGVGVWDLLRVRFWGHFWCFLRSFLVFLRSFLTTFCVIFGSILGVFGHFGGFWSVLLYPFASFWGWCQIFAFLVIFDLFWPFLGVPDRIKKTPKPLFGPPKKPFSEAFQAAIFRKHKNSILAKVDPLNFGPSNRTFYRSNKPFHFSKRKKL